MFLIYATTPLKTIRIPLPPPHEQKAIAKALSNVDELIEGLDKLIAKKRNIKQATMQQLLTGKRRLPGFSISRKMQQTDIGAIPEDWTIAPLSMVCENGGLIRGPFGGSLKKESFSTSGYKVYSQQNAIYGNELLGDYFVSDAKRKELKRFDVKQGDFIVSCSGTIGRIHQISENAQKGIINQALLIIRTNPNISKDYFLFRFRSRNFQALIIDSTQGGAMQNLVGMSTFKNTPIILPSLVEQTAIAKVLSDMDEEIEALEARRDKTKALKQGMMQELLTKRIRLV